MNPLASEPRSDPDFQEDPSAEIGAEATAPESRLPLLRTLRAQKKVDLLLLLGILVSLVVGAVAFKREQGYPPVWWDAEGYRQLEESSRGMDRATFLSDGSSQVHNTRLHSTQYAIIPCVLRLTLEWSEVFARLDSGEFLVCDYSKPAALDAAIDELKTWAAKEKRDVIAQRLSPHIALLKAGERP